MESNRLNFMLGLAVLLQSFQTYQGEGKIIDFTESWHQFADCFFTILCELVKSVAFNEHVERGFRDEGYTFHGPLTLISYESLEFAHDQLLKLLTPEKPITIEDIMSETFLKTEAKKLLCNLTEDERNDLENDYGAAGMNHLSEVCSQPLKWEVCQKLDEATSSAEEVLSGIVM